MIYSVLIKKTVLFLLVFLSLPALALQTPTGVTIIPTYAPIVSPVLATTAENSKPIAMGNIADGGDSLSVNVGLESLENPADVYFAIFIPKFAPDTVFFLNDSGGIVPFNGSLPPWKTNVSNALNEVVLPDIPVALLPGADYFFFLLLTPAGNGITTLDNLYLWSSKLTLTPNAEEFANTLVDQFGADANSVVALLEGFDKGYSLQQIVDAVFAGHFTADSNVLDANGALVKPALEPLDLIISSDTTKATQKSFSPVTEDALFKAIYEVINIGGEEGFVNERRGIVLLLTIISELAEKDVSPDEIFEAIFFGLIIISNDSVTLWDGPPADPASKQLGENKACSASTLKQVDLPFCVFSQPKVDTTSSENDDEEQNDTTLPPALDRGKLESIQISVSGFEHGNDGSFYFKPYLSTGGYPYAGQFIQYGKAPVYQGDSIGYTQPGTAQINFSEDGRKIVAMNVEYSSFPYAEGNGSLQYKFSASTTSNPYLETLSPIGATSKTIRYKLNGIDVCNYDIQYALKHYDRDGQLIHDERSKEIICSEKALISVYLYFSDE